MDRSAGVMVGRVQPNFRTSRRLHGQRHGVLEPQIGPLRFEILEGIRTYRVTLAPNESGIACDLRAQELQSFRRRLSRVDEDLTRMSQLAQIRAQDDLFAQLLELDPALPALPAGPRVPGPCLRGQDLLTLRDAGNAVIARLVSGPTRAGAGRQGRMDALLAGYVRLELALERPHLAKPMFAQMSSGQH